MDSASRQPDEGANDDSRAGRDTGLDADHGLSTCSSGAGGRGSILVVDDHDGVREALILSMEISARDVTLQGCATAEDALALLQENHCSLAIIDLLMPGMSGLELARRIRDLERQSSRPPMSMVAISALPADQIWDQCREAGYNKLLTKPFRRADLMACLDEFLPGCASTP